MSEARQSYHAHLEREGYAVATIRAYVKDLEALEAFAAHLGKPMREFGASDLGPLLADPSLSHRSRRRRHQGLIRFGRWAVQTGLWSSNLPEAHPRLREDRSRPEVSWEDVQAAVEAFEPRRGERGRVVLLLLAFEALSPGEVHALTWADVDLGARTCTVAASVDRPARTIRLQPATVEALRAWSGYQRKSDRVWPHSDRALRRAVSEAVGFTPKQVQKAALQQLVAEHGGSWSRALERSGYADASSLMRACGRFSG